MVQRHEPVNHKSKPPDDAFWAMVNRPIWDAAVIFYALTTGWLTGLVFGLSWLTSFAVFVCLMYWVNRSENGYDNIHLTGNPMLDIEREMLVATERRRDWRREAERYRLAKMARMEQGQRADLGLALTSRSYSILRQVFIQLLPFKSTFRPRSAAQINPR